MRRTLARPVFLLLAITLVPLRAQPAQDARAWIETSNRHAQMLLDVFARFAPEGAAQVGVSGLDEEVTNLTAETQRRARAATEAALARLRELQKSEPQPQVRQDLEILIRSARNGPNRAD